MSEPARRAGKRTASDTGLDALVSASKSSKHHDTDSPSDLKTKPGLPPATDFRGALRKLQSALNDNQKAKIEQEAEHLKKAHKKEARDDYENLQHKYRQEADCVAMIDKLKMDMMDELMLSGKVELKKELEHDVREELKAELKAELIQTVYADYAKEYKQHKATKTLELQKELVPEVKEQLVADFTKGVYLELRKEMGQDDETKAAMRAELMADMAEEVREELIKELAPGIIAELRKQHASLVNHAASAGITSSAQDDTAGSVDGKAHQEEATSKQKEQVAEGTDELRIDAVATLEREQPAEDKATDVASGNEEAAVSNEQKPGEDYVGPGHHEAHDSINNVAKDGPFSEDPTDDVRQGHGFSGVDSHGEENFSNSFDSAAEYARNDQPDAYNADNQHVGGGSSLDDYEDEEHISLGDNEAAEQFGTNGQPNQNVENGFDSYPTQRRMSGNTGTSKDDPIDIGSESDDGVAGDQDGHMDPEDKEEEIIFPAGDGLHITHDGYVADISGTGYGVLVTDNLYKVVGLAVNEFGHVLDHDDQIVGQADRFESMYDGDEEQDDEPFDPAAHYAGSYEGNGDEIREEEYEDDEEEEEYVSDGYGEYSNYARYQDGSVSPADTDDEIDEVARSMGYGPRRSSSAPVARRNDDHEDADVSSYSQPAYHPATSTSSGPYHEAAQRDPSRYAIDENYDEDYEDPEDPDSTLVEEDLPTTIDETQVLGITKEKSLFLHSDSDSDPDV